MSRIMNRHKFLTALVCAAALAGCEKNGPQDITGPLPSARIKFFNFGVSSPAVNFYANTTKFTAISSAACSPTPTDTMIQRVCREGGQESTAGVAQGAAAAGGFEDIQVEIFCDGAGIPNEGNIGGGDVVIYERIGSAASGPVSPPRG